MIILTSKDVPARSFEAQRLLQRNLGRSYRELWNGPNTDVFIAFVDGKMVAVAISELASSELRSIFAAHLKPEHERYKPSLKSAKPVGLLTASAVHPDYRRQGVASALTAARIAALNKKGCELALVESWVTGNSDNSSHLYKKMGFQEIAHISGYWKGDDSSRCAICEVGCSCSARLYIGEI